MGRRFLWCAAGVLLSGISFLYGEELTLDQCLAKAQENNPDVQKALSGLTASQARRRQARAAFFPTVSVGALYTRVSEPPPRIELLSPAAPGGLLPQIAGNPLLQYVGQDNYSAYFRAVQPLYTGGRNRGALRASTADENAREAELGLARQKLSADVVKAFYGVIVAREMRALSLEARAQLKEHLDTVEKFMRSGMATEYDHLKTRVQYLSWGPRVAQAERELKNAVRRLNLLMGQDPGYPVEVKGALNGDIRRDSLTLEQAQAAALRDRPELSAARAGREAVAETGNILRSALFPRLNLQYDYNFQDQNASFTLDRDAWKTWWTLRLALGWELFSSGRRQAELEENRSLAGQAQADLDALSRRIKGEVADALEYRIETEKAVEQRQENVALAQRGYEIAVEKYNNGRLTNLDVLDSQVALVDARVQYVKALYDYLTARTELERAAGGGLSGEGMTK
ncbi:MAG: TolC family protein [Endomicrobiales bacterium]